MIATKDQERKALEEIRKIVDNLGENSYVGAAMEGVLELAEDNIENDFTQSMKESAETAEKRAHELEEENERLEATLNTYKKFVVKEAKEKLEEANGKLEEARACILPEEVRQKFYGIAFDKKYKAQAEAMTAAERMAEAVECGENARPDAIRYRAMTEEVKEWKDIIKLLDNIARKQAGR